MPRESEAKIRFSVFNKDYRKGIKEINDENRRMKNEFKLTDAQLRNSGTETDKLKNKIERLGTEKSNVRRKIQLTEQQLEKAKDVYGENSVEANKLADDLVKLQTSEQRIENAIQDATTELNKQSDALANAEAEAYAKKIEDAGKAVEDLGKKMQDQGRNLSNFGKAWTMRVSAPLLGFAGAALKVGMDFEEGMSKVQAISGATGDELEQLNEQARDLGANTRFSATEAAGGMEYLAMAGFETNEIMSAMPGLLDLAASSNMDLARAADIASNIISGFGYEADDAGRVADVLAKGASSANTNVEQLGDAMATVAPIASALGLDVEGLTAAVGLMSDAGIQGSTAGRQLRQGLLRLADPTGAAADLIEELNIEVFDADGNMKELHEVVDELGGGLDGMSSQAQTAALSTLFGSQSVAGWTALLERGSDELADYTDELENSEGAASEMADVMQDNAKGALIEFKSALEGAGIELAEHMLPVVTDFVERITEMVRRFSDLDDEQKEQIIKWGLIAIAVGPVATLMGNVLTVTGKLTSGAGLLVQALGTAKGGGLLAKFGVMGVATGPVAVAIGGIGLLAAGIYVLSEAMEQNLEDTVDLIQTRRDELDSLDEAIERYEELQRANQLTTDEILRYLDIMTLIEEAESEKEIEKLTNEQERLAEKSGLTNEELEEFLKLNDFIIEKSPEAADAVSEQGNAYVEQLDNLKALQAAERERLTQDTYLAITNELRDQSKNLREQRQLNEDIDNLEKERQANNQSILDYNGQIMDLDLEIVELKNDQVGASWEEIQAINETLALRESDKRIIEQLRQEQIEKNDLIGIEIEKKEENLEQIGQELALFDELTDDYAQMVLYEAGIVSEKGKANEALREQQDELDEAKKKLMEAYGQNEITTREFENQNDELIDMQNKIDTATQKLEHMNTVAKEDINKNIYTNLSPSADTINTQLSAPVNKRIQAQGYGFRALGYADGTNYHPGGPALVGEEGPELVKYRNKYELLTFGLHNLKRGSKVYTAKQTEQAFKKGRVPSYADGVGNVTPPNLGESLASFRENQINNSVTVIVQPTEVKLDNEQVGRIQWEVVNDHINRHNELIKNFQGG